jgi:hypothetical protein
MVLVNTSPALMNAQIARQIAQLHDLTTKQLRAKYQELSGSESRARNRQFLFRRVAWRLQALADLRLRPTRRFHAFTIEQSKRDWRLPEVGSTLRRSWQQKLHSVQVCADGFSWEGKKYRSLSAVAFVITGTRWNGYAFFGLQEKKHG